MSVTSPHSNLIVNRRVEAKIERQARLAGHCLFIVHCGLFSQRRKAWIYAAAAHLDPQIWSQLRHPDPDGRADDFKWLQTKLSLLVRSLSCHEAPCSGGIEGSSRPFILCKPLTGGTSTCLQPISPPILTRANGDATPVKIASLVPMRRQVIRSNSASQGFRNHLNTATAPPVMCPCPCRAFAT